MSLFDGGWKEFPEPIPETTSSMNIPTPPKFYILILKTRVVGSGPNWRTEDFRFGFGYPKNLQQPTTLVKTICHYACYLFLIISLFKNKIKAKKEVDNKKIKMKNDIKIVKQFIV